MEIARHIRALKRPAIPIAPLHLLGKGRLLEPKSPSRQNARLRAGIEKETEGVALVSGRQSPRQFPLHPYRLYCRGAGSQVRELQLADEVGESHDVEDYRLETRIAGGLARWGVDCQTLL
jgi:hypothetical protein